MSISVSSVRRGILLAAALLPLPVVTSVADAQRRRGDDGRPDAPEEERREIRDSMDVNWRVAVPRIRIQHMRPRDQRGLHVFEPPKHDDVPYRGFALQLGAAFTQQFQGLTHENDADSVRTSATNPADANRLIGIGNGMPNAVANLYLDAQLARGLRVAMTMYLSSRHHNETWVKDGYFLIDGSPFENELLDRLMEHLTLRVGHFEINYGDAHFRRTDNGQALWNPLVGNYILDAFTTEIGAEAYWRQGPVLLMGGLTGGEIRGQVTAAERRSASWIGKIGFDQQVTPDLRVRLTGSTYGTGQSNSNTLYTGDRAGSPYFLVLENAAATEAANAWSGQVRPGFANRVHAYVANPFVQYRGLELFGHVETATGKAATEARTRSIRQLVGEGVYRFGPREQFYGAGRWNRVAGRMAAGLPDDTRIERWQAGGGWFITPLVLVKGEWVDQRYHDFPRTDIRSGGRFHGFVLSGNVAF